MKVRTKILVNLVCDFCRVSSQRLVWNPTQLAQFCSTACRLAARGYDPNPGTVREQRIRNRAFIKELNARTFCAHCGAQPVEWHNPEHVQLNRQAYRISALVQAPRSIAVIEAELARCTPLCRKCHMAEDGRLSRFYAMASAPKTYLHVGLLPCTSCSKPAKPLRRGLCNACNSRERYYRKTETGENWGAVARRESARRHLGQPRRPSITAGLTREERSA